MSAVGRDALDALYASTDDPWNFRTSDYERAKYDATIAALPRTTFRSILEIGCGNGELARRLAPRAERYTGVDAVEVALDAARRAVPEGRFHRVYLPCDLPTGAHDLLVLSEILYFLDEPGLGSLAVQIDRRWPAAELLCVTWLGPSGNALEGGEALRLFGDATARATRCVRMDPAYRIDLFAPLSEKEGRCE
ncbi:SAM-dependent methyltransferase [uncultured Jannaschia sp.]|uniref:SAM-dependent methyltransferase n=1 Tax=uncultured Jannaschia sp. TaxID=293347 RepID=UPI00260EB090|nr:SAM-dependent methyltransferase [uncultured Jannaschia sp.]